MARKSEARLEDKERGGYGRKCEIEFTRSDGDRRTIVDVLKMRMVGESSRASPVIRTGRVSGP
jgi:hypothetical protein